MKKTCGLAHWTIVCLTKSAKVRPLGLYAVTGIDRINGLVGLYTINDAQMRSEPFISIETIRLAKPEEKVEFLLAWFNVNALIAVLTSCINGVFPQFIEALKETGMTRKTLEFIPSLKCGLQMMDNPVVLHQFFDSFEK